MKTLIYGTAFASLFLLALSMVGMMVTTVFEFEKVPLWVKLCMILGACGVPFFISFIALEAALS